MNVKYFHIRNQYGYNISNNGGLTIAWTTLEGSLVFATSECSTQDNFNKKTGRELAEQRLKAGNSKTIPSDIIVSDYCEKLTIFGLSKASANRVRQTLTLNDLSLTAIKEIVLDNL